MEDYKQKIQIASYEKSSAINLLKKWSEAVPGKTTLHINGEINIPNRIKKYLKN